MEGTTLAGRLAVIWIDPAISLGNQMAPVRADHCPSHLPDGGGVSSPILQVGFRTQLLQVRLNRLHELPSLMKHDKIMFHSKIEVTL